MQSFSIWHWLVAAIPIVLVVVVVCAIWLFARAINNRRLKDRSVKDRSNATPVAGPSGFQGWLVLLAIGVFLSPIYTIYLISHLEDGADDAMLQRLRLALNVEIGLFVAVLVLQICTAFFMARRAKRFVSFYIVTAIATILVQPADLILLAAIISAQVGQSFQLLLQRIVTPDDIGKWISTGVTFGIWMLYVIRSRRVANTFVR